jgi:hypothetical protein
MTSSASLVDTQPPTAAAPPAPSAAGPVQIDRSLVDRACLGDDAALQMILRQFIDAGEPIDVCEYLGTLGIQPFGQKSFAVLTPKRVGSLRIGWLGYVLYQDAPLEYTVSGIILQPSKLALYIWLAFTTLLVMSADVSVFMRFMAAPGAGNLIAILLLPVMAALLALTWLIVVRLFYAFRKCGMVWAVREGVAVYAFTNRGRMNIANRLHRRIFELREERIRDLPVRP